MIPLKAIEHDEVLFKKAISQVTPEVLGSIIDLSELKPIATQEDIRRVCEMANKIGSRICIHGGRVAYAATLVRDYFPQVRGIVAVIDFPFGAGTTEAKVASAYSVLAAGAQEIDMVLNVGKLLDGDKEFVRKEIALVAEVVVREELKTGSPRVLKVIQENCSLPGRFMMTFRPTTIIGHLAEEMKVHMFAKTSSGFGIPWVDGAEIGAQISDVRAMARIAEKVRRKGVGREECRMGVKASAGIKRARTAVRMMLAGGCFDDDLTLRNNLPDIFRLGTSSQEIVYELEQLKLIYK